MNRSEGSRVFGQGRTLCFRGLQRGGQHLTGVDPEPEKRDARSARHAITTE